MEPKSTKILLLTLSEYGQANTMLALTSELSSRENLSVHFSSFPRLQKRVEALRARMSNEVRKTTSLEFHVLPGKSFAEVLDSEGMTIDIARHAPLKDSLKGFELLKMLIAPWPGPEYMALVEAIKALILKIDADMIVVDTLFSAAIDACRTLRRRYVVNSPVQTLDLVKMVQPRLSGFWKYPSMGSGISFPIPWGQIHSNLWVTFNAIYAFMQAPRTVAHQEYRLAHGLKGRVPIADAYREELDYITPSVRETDYPFSYLPENVKMFGPILLDAPSVEEVDPEMAAWLRKPGRRTVVVNLGSNMQYDEKLMRGIISGLVNGVPNDVQIIWKIENKPEVVKRAKELAEEYDSSASKSGRWNIVGWLDADPIAILQHEGVACFVHHGGANSYFECCSSGTPQIILPQWFDLYDNADKAEYNGFGINGSKTCAPDVDGVEFGAALARVLGDHEEAKRLRQKAKEVARLCREAGGRKAAIDYVLETIKRGKTMEALC